MFGKEFEWNEEKNKQLKKERGIGFEEVFVAIENNKVLEVVDHHNPSRYPRQSVAVVEIQGYAYLVPFVEEEEKIFFKTIIPSRKATKKHLK
jgi:uncharacterized DUF497 family protein